MSDLILLFACALGIPVLGFVILVKADIMWNNWQRSRNVNDRGE